MSFFVFSALPSSAQNLKIWCVWGGGGGGTCAVVQGPNGTVVLLDETGGRTEAKALYNDILVPNGINYINYAIAGHYDSDHYGGLDDVVSSMGGAGNFGVFYDRGGSKQYDGSNVSSSYLNLVNGSGKRRTVSLDGSSDIDLGNGAVIRFLSVGAPDTEKVLHIRGGPDMTSGLSENNKSISALVTYGGFDFYFGSDLEGNGERAVAPVITQTLGRKVDVLHVDHHGAETNGTSSTTFLYALDPEVAVLSVWNSNSFGHPRRTTVENLEQVVEPVAQRIIRLEAGDYSDPDWAPENMAYCHTTNRHLLITTDGGAYTVDTVDRAGGNDLTEPGLVNHPVDEPSNIQPPPTPTPFPVDNMVCPIAMHTDRSEYGTSDTITITVDACAVRDFTPYIRFVAPGDNYYYLTSSGMIYTGAPASGSPYVKGPVTLSADIVGMELIKVSYSNVAPGSYSLQGAFLDRDGLVGIIGDADFEIR